MPSATAQPSAGGEKQKTLAEMDQPWDHAVFRKPPTGAARWGTCQKWIYRTHPKARVGLFHPLHSSYPPEAGELSGQRVSIVFYDGKAAEPEIHLDHWDTPPDKTFKEVAKAKGKWTGFTFFQKKLEENGPDTGPNQAEHAPDGGSPAHHPAPVGEDSPLVDDGFELVNPISS